MAKTTIVQRREQWVAAEVHGTEQPIALVPTARCRSGGSRDLGVTQAIELGDVVNQHGQIIGVGEELLGKQCLQR